MGVVWESFLVGMLLSALQIKMTPPIKLEFYFILFEPLRSKKPSI